MSVPIRQQNTGYAVNPRLIAALRRTISSARLGPYMEAAGYDDDRALNLYLWNVTIGQSFYFPLQTLEISLRNSIGEVFRSEFGEKWWRNSIAKTFLDERGLEDLNTIRARLLRRKIKVDADEMVSAMSFGFWVATLAPKHRPKIWSKHLPSAFPHLPNGVTQRHIYQCADRSLLLRNKIFHHEPLIGLNLSGSYSELMKLLGWVCIDTQKWVKAHCSVPTLMRAKP